MIPILVEEASSIDKIGLLATARAKSDHPEKVINFYKSPLFIKSVEYAKQHYHRLYFYNAKDGLLLPDQWISPYDISIKTFSLSEKKAWAHRVIASLREFEHPNEVCIYLHGGMIYRKFLEPELLSHNFQFQVPLKGFSIGQQLKWFSEKLTKEGSENEYNE